MKELDLRKVKGEMRFKREYQKYLDGQYKSLDELGEFFGLPRRDMETLIVQLDLPRRPQTIKVDMDKFIEVYNRYASRKIRMLTACEELGVSYPTWHKMMLELGEARWDIYKLGYLYDMQKEYEWLQEDYKRQSKATKTTTQPTEPTNN